MNRPRCGGLRAWTWASAGAGREHNLTVPPSAGETRCGRSHAAKVNEYLESRGVRISRGTIVDATILAMPSSTKNRSGERDPEMHQTRKGKQWYFGLKAHVGVDSKQGHVHSVCTSAASVEDSTAAGPAARRRTKSVGRWRVSGTGRSDPARLRRHKI